MTTAADRRPRPAASYRTQLAATAALFAVFGAMFGGWQVLLPELASSLALTPGALGTALSLGFVASLPAMAVGGRAVDRWGTASTIAVSALFIALAVGGVALVETALVLVPLLLAFFAATGAYDVAINASAMHLQTGSNGRGMALAHASFSGGGAAGAITIGALLGSGIEPRVGYALVAGMVVVAVGLVLLARVVPGARRHADADVARIPSGSRRAVMLLALLTTLAFFSEGAMENWSAIHLRSTLGGSAVLGAAGVAVFHGAMLIGRLAAAGVLARVSRLAVLRGAGVATAAGMLVALATTSPVVTLAGLLCVGLALSAVAPICFSLAGDAAPQARGSASALITTVGYTGFLVGPVLIGWVAELTTLRIALGAVVLAGVLVAVSTSRLAGSTTTTAAAPP